MAYNFQPLDQALDSLGFSYIDGVNVEIASKYRVDCDLSDVRTILDAPAPSVLAFDSNYDTSYEKQVLEDLDKRSETEKTKAQERSKRIEEYEQKKKEEIEQRKKDEEEKALEDERKRLQELEDVKRAKLEAEKKLIEEERRLLEEEGAKRRKEEEEKANKKKEEDEAEWKRFEEERSRRDSVSCDKSTEDEFRTPPQEPKTPEEINFTLQSPPAKVEPAPVSKSAQLPVAGIIVKGVQNPVHNYTNINFSDFEATSDPFADLELKSINDMAELQSILGSVAMANSTHTPSQSQAQNNQNTYTPASVYPPQHQPGHHPQYLTSSMTPSQALASRLAQNSYQPSGPGSNFGYNYPGGYGGHQPPPHGTQPQQFYPQFYPTPVSSYQSQQVPSSQPQTAFIAQARKSPGPGQTQTSQNSLVAQDREQVTRSISSDRDRPHRTERLKDGVETEAVASNGELKRVKSVGDMISELQREAEALNNHKKKSPTSRPTSRGATGLENWTPWPTLDQEGAGSAQTPSESSGRGDESCLASLRSEDAGLCRQLHEMGFPLPRLAKGVSAVGADSQKLINFCLVVDRLVDEGFSIEASEDVSVLHNADEDVCRKHLRSFQQIAEIGFPSKDVHQALIAASFDHQKALDQLIR